MWNDLWPTFNEEKRIRKLEYLGLDGAGPWSSLPGQRNGMREGMVVQINIEMGKENLKPAKRKSEKQKRR